MTPVGIILLLSLAAAVGVFLGGLCLRRCDSLRRRSGRLAAETAQLAAENRRLRAERAALAAALESLPGLLASGGDDPQALHRFLRAYEGVPAEGPVR